MPSNSLTTAAERSTAPTRILRPQPGPQERFLSSPADIVIYGGGAGAGKTFGVILEASRHTGNPGFGATILRRTTKEIVSVGGLWDEAENVFGSMGAVPKVGDLSWSFPSGAVVKFDHMEHEKDRFKYQGAQIPLIVFDELTHFTETQFWYMVSRSRSTCGVRPYIRGTCNPDAKSFVAKLIAWWIDPTTGYAIPERSGVVRYLIRVNGVIHWGDSREELAERFPGHAPKSFTFIPAKLEDNPALTEKDPDYLANLQSLPLVEQERLLGGNWKIVDTDGCYWPPEYFTDIWTDTWPEDRHLTAVALDPSLGKSDKSDYPAFVAVRKGHDGVYYIQADIERRPATELVDAGIEWMRGVGVDAFGCETNQFQELLASMFEGRIADAGLTMREVYGIHNHVPKVTRIRSLSNLLSQGRIKLYTKSSGCELLCSQLQEFPNGDHDDGPDALEMAIRLCEELLAGTGVEDG